MATVFISIFSDKVSDGGYSFSMSVAGLGWYILVCFQRGPSRYEPSGIARTTTIIARFAMSSTADHAQDAMLDERVRVYVERVLCAHK